VNVATFESLYRAEWGRLLAALIRDCGHFDTAEEALQNAFAAAARSWTPGWPPHPAGWIYKAARNDIIDCRRHEALTQRKHAELALLSAEDVGEDLNEEGDVHDERLRLIFTCCHPALAPESQVALTLRTLCGLTTEEIARAFLVATPTMAQRLVRAKAKIQSAGIPYRVPEAADLPDRLTAVLTVIYLVFNEGYAAASGTALVRKELCQEAIRLARLLKSLLAVSVPELDGLLALMLLQDSRSDARLDGHGDLILLQDQDRRLWKREQIDEGIALVKGTRRRGPPGAFLVEAAIAAVHAESTSAEQTDWAQIVALYARLQRQHKSAIVDLNAAVALMMADGPAAALPSLTALGAELEDYHPWHLARAEALLRLGRQDDAAHHLRRAYALAGNAVERRYIARKLARCEAVPT
jgi:RNA polymerase sigma-70 factor (ECF subfamily)